MLAKPQQFSLHVPDTEIADLNARLALTRLPDEAPGSGWAYGTSLQYMHGLIDYWRTRFDWRAEETRLNAFPQFKVPMAGIDLHYLHVKGVGPAPKPLLLMHGWPGSVFEFIDIIPRLTDPARFGGKADDAFTVIAPSLPGYGLSFSRNQKRFTIPDISDCLAELMTSVLGYSKFAAQGGDWGAFTCSAQNSQLCDRHWRHHARSSSSNCGDSIAWRSRRPLPISTRISMRLLSISPTRSMTTSPPRSPAP